MAEGIDLKNVMDEILGSDEFEGKAEVGKAAAEESRKEAPETTIIAENVEIQGNVMSHSDLVIRGTVKGNVSCDGAMVLEGSVYGNVNSSSLEFKNGVIEGNVEVQEKVSAQNGTRITGDVKAQTAEFGGLINGNITVEDIARFESSSSVKGDVRADLVQVERGARICGRLDVFPKEEMPAEPENYVGSEEQN